MRVDWKAVLGIAITVGLLWWLFRNENPAEIWAAVQSADLLLLFAAVVVTTFGFVVRAIRWRWLLEPLHPENSFRPRFAAVAIHFMVNNLAPARLGEFARVFAYSKLEPVSFSGTLATLVVARILDGVTILALLFMVLAGPAFPAETLHPAVAAGINGLSVLLGGLLLVLVALLVAPEATLRFLGVLARPLPAGVGDRLVDAARAFVAGLESLRRPSLMIRALGWSFVFWVLQSLSFWLGILAFGIDLPFSAAVFMNATIAFAVAIPAAPGFFGTFQAGAKVALVDVYGVALAPALAFSIAWHLGAFFPITFIGLWYSGRLGFSLKDFQDESGRDEKDVDPRGEGTAADPSSLSNIQQPTEDR